jgi:ankyrin repeat protein
MAATEQGHDRIVARLIAAGADVGISDFTGRTALDLAREGRSRKVIQLLQQAGER